jgi:DNA-binding response OmpR family regulator
MTGTRSQRILVIEDDQRMLELLCKGLREVGHTAMPASDGDSGLDLAMNYDFDAIILDLGLPGRDGFDIAACLRASNKITAILVLTARDSEDDIIRGLESGADHYLVKPFSFAEVLARLDSLSRTSRRTSPESSLGLNPVRLTALRENTLVRLTRTEYLLLATLHHYIGKPVSRHCLIESIWGNEPIGSNALEVLVNSLRNKFDLPYSTKRIVTVRGTGYMLEAGISNEQDTHSDARSFIS